MDDSECFLCGLQGGQAQVVCPCGAFLCSSDHVALHGLDGNCFPIRRITKKGYGQCLVTTRDVQPLELVLKDNPAPICAKNGFCISCHGKIKEEHKCAKCFVPYFCSDECSSNSLHVDTECELFSGCPSSSKFEDRHKFYESLMPLRLLLLKEAQPVTWSRLQGLEDHAARRHKEESTVAYFEENVVAYLRDELQLNKLFSKEEIDWALGLIRINGIQTKKYRSIFPTMAMINNSCISNCFCSHDENENIIIRAQVFLKAGTEIKIGYNSIFTGIIERKVNFRNTWFFDCDCERCSDPRECGSDFNALVCPKKDKGLCRPFDWRCDVCHDVMYTTNQVKELEQQFLRDIKKDQSNLTECSDLIALFESRLISPSADIFHVSHYIKMFVKSNLISLYGNGPKYYYSQMPKDLIRRKVTLCEEFVAVMERIDPGETDWRAATFYERLQAEAFLAQGELLAMNEENKAEIYEKFKNILHGLKSVHQKLKYAKFDDHLGDMKNKSMESIKTLKEIILYLDIL